MNFAFLKKQISLHKKKLMDIKMNYKITVLTSSRKYEGYFLTKKAATTLVITLRRIDKEFKKAILQENVDGQWVTIWEFEEESTNDN